MSDKPIVAHARVQIVVEVQRTGYGGEWKLQDMMKQCGDEAVMDLRAILKDSRTMRIIGEPHVIAVLAEREK